MRLHTPGMRVGKCSAEVNPFTVPSLPPSPIGWKYSSGFVSDEMISGHLPPPGAKTQILMCGPPPMIKFACLPNLDKLGYSKDMYVAF